MWPKSHHFIPLEFGNYDRHLEKVAELYNQGLSLCDIARDVGLTKATVRNLVLRAGIPLRPLRAGKGPVNSRVHGKRHAKPPYGFAYFEGCIVKHPKEYPFLLSIIGQWKSGRSLNSIATNLNDKRVPSPMGKKWSWNSIANIIQRIKSGQLVPIGDKYELR